MRICGRHFVILVLSSLALAGCGGSDSGDSSFGGSENLPPIITGSPPTQLTAGSSYSFTPQATDPNGDAVTFRATGLPSWLSINATTGALTGTPSESNVGTTEMITVEATDSRAASQLPQFRIQVNSSAQPAPPPNTPPTIQGTPATTAIVGQSYTFTPVADDVDDNGLTFTVQNLPAWLTFTASTGLISGTPAAANVGTASGIVISVNDGIATTSLPAFNITVSAPTTPPTNRAPTITGTPATSVTAGSAYSFRPVASDPDGNSLQFSIQNRPTWATFSTSTGRLSGTPTSANVGTTSSIILSVTDGTATTSLPGFTLHVRAQANRAPTISGTPPASVVTNVAYTFTPTASDPDGDTLTFSVDNLPAWATFNTSNGRISGTPVDVNVGSFSGIVIRVADGRGGTASLPSFSINVTAATTNGSAQLNWVTPTQNTDGSSLPSFTGYRIVYGRELGTLDQTVTLNNTSLTTYRVEGLSSGVWYFAMRTVNGSSESDLTNLASITIQ